MASGEGTVGAIRAAQLVLQQSTPSLIIDGRWGGTTQAAYDRSTGDEQVEVDAVLSGAGLTAAILSKIHRAQKAANTAEYVRNKATARMERSVTKPDGDVARSVILDALRKASERSGVPYDWLLLFATIESSLKANATNGRSRGLMQIQTDAWSDVQKVDPSVGSYYSNVMDPYVNAYVGARYLQLNEKWLRRYGYTDEITPAVLYLAHQQGAAGFVELWRASKGMSAVSNHVKVERMLRNAPQDKQGVTTDKAEFFRRWMTVAEKKFASQSLNAQS